MCTHCARHAPWVAARDVALWGRYTRGVQPTTRGVQPTTRDHTWRATYHTWHATYHTSRATYHTWRAYNTRHWTCARVDVIRGERGEQWVGEELHGDGQDRLVLHSHEARGIVPKRRTASLTKRQMTSRADDILNVRRKGTQQSVCSSKVQSCLRELGPHVALERREHEVVHAMHADPAQRNVLQQCSTAAMTGQHRCMRCCTTIAHSRKAHC